MQINNLIIVGVLCFVFTSNLASAQTKQVYLKSEIRKVVEYLKNNDTAGIHGMFAFDETYNDIKDDIKGDGKLIGSIIEKYGVNELDSMVFKKGRNDENMVVVTLLNKPGFLCYVS